MKEEKIFCLEELLTGILGVTGQTEEKTEKKEDTEV